MESGSLWQSQCYNHSAATSCSSKDRYLNSAVPLLTNTHSVTHPPPKPQSQPAWCNTHFTLTGIRAPYLDVFMSSALLLIHAHPLLPCVQPSLNDEAQGHFFQTGHLISVLLEESDVLESTNYNKISCMLAITDNET